MGVQRDRNRKGGDSTGPILHGDRTIVVVEQGFIGFALDKGQPVLLPPGLHQWKSATMQFIKCYDLNNNVIRMGPLTLVTVDEGYAAVTEDNGQQKILEGGDTYLLTHRNWKFQKYITQKIQSNDLKRIQVSAIRERRSVSRVDCLDSTTGPSAPLGPLPFVSRSLQTVVAV